MSDNWLESVYLTERFTADRVLSVARVVAMLSTD